MTVYARERLEDAIRAVAEDVMSPSRPTSSRGTHETAFDDDLDRVLRDIAASAYLLLAERLRTSSPRAAERGRTDPSTPRWPEQA